MRLAPLALAAGLLLALAGCVPSDARPSASPSASATPVFASDAEALAAAEKAYAAYLKVSDEVASDGGQDPGRLEGLATGNLLSDDQAGFRSFVAKGWHSVGATKLVNTVLQSVDLHSESSEVGAVVTYLCENVAEVQVLDEEGTSVVSATRPDKQQFQVTFDLVKSKLIPSGREPWTATAICS